MREFTCELCRKTYEFDWSEEEAEKEYAETFPDDLNRPRSVVCEDCYNILVPSEG